MLVIYNNAVKIAISDQSFEDLIGNLNLPSFLIDRGLNFVLKSNLAGKQFLENNKEILSSINIDETIEQLDSIGVFYIKNDHFIRTFTSVNIEGVRSILLSITELETNKEIKVFEETSKAFKKEVVNHFITKKQLDKSQEFSDNLINNNSDMLLMIAENGLINNCNKNIYKTLGYSFDELVGKHVETLLFGSPDFTEMYSILIKNKKYEGEINTITKDGKIIPTYISINSYCQKGNDYVLVIKDLSDKITIKKQALKMKAIFDSGNHMIWSVNKKMALTSFNENYKNIFINKYNEEPSLNRQLHTIEYRETKDETERDFWNQKYNEAFSGNTVFFEYTLTHIDGKIEYKEIHLNPIIDENNEILEVSGLGIDITERKLTALKLNKNTARYNSIFNNSSVFIWSIDKDKKITSCNHSFEIVMRSWFNRLVSINSDFEDYFNVYENDKAVEIFKKNFKSVLKNKKNFFEISINISDSKIKYLEIYMSPICYEVDEISEISCIAIDITETKNSSKELGESLKEKETLLQEVHHRVKNNLQIISSILNLQASYIKDDNSLKILTESQNRIKSMSFIHESLYINNNFRYINFTDYIKSLTGNLIQSYAVSPDQVKFISNVEDVQLSLDQAIPCGLILNELISNSLKYAFPNNTKGEITLNISEENDNVRLELGDNGIGIEDDFDVEKSESLGLQLVFILVEQLDGNIEIQNKKGSVFLINFDKIKNS